MGAPFAYFLTWTCYGTWLHGDARGSVDDAQNAAGTPYLQRNDHQRSDRYEALSEPPFVLDNESRCEVESSIQNVCNVRGWDLHAVSVRTNHIHVVVTAADSTPEQAAALFKSWGTRALKKRAGHAGRKKFWTNQASTRSLYSGESLIAAINYTESQ